MSKVTTLKEVLSEEEYGDPPDDGEEATHKFQCPECSNTAIYVLMPDLVAVCTAPDCDYVGELLE